MQLSWSSSLSTTSLHSHTPPTRTHSLSHPNHITVASKEALPTSSSAINITKKKKEKELSQILRTESAVEAIERKANSKKYNNLWPRAILEALDDAIRSNRHVSALKIFGLLRKQHWYKPRCQTYVKLLMMLGKCKQPHRASHLFELMLVEGLKPTLGVYTALISAYGQSGLLDEAFSILESMKSVSDCKPDVYAYSVLISSCIRFYHFEKIDCILAEMSYLGIDCNAVTYNTIIDGYGKAKMFELMEKSLADMIEASCLPDVFTLNSVVGAYGKSGQVDAMEKWYGEFQLMGIRPDVITYNILIGSYGKTGLYEKMKSVIDYMEKRFIAPTIETYNIVIDTYGKAGNLGQMDMYFKKMKHQGLKPNSVTYCSLVSAYGKARLMPKVESVLRQVCNSDVVLDTAFFNCSISAYGQAGDIKQMNELFSVMKERKCIPDHITFATMIHAYNAQGMTEAARDLEIRLLQHNTNPLPHNTLPDVILG